MAAENSALPSQE